MGNSFEKFVFTGSNPVHIWDRHRHRTMPAQQTQHQQCGGERNAFRQQHTVNSQTGKVAACGCTTKTLPHGNSTPNLGDVASTVQPLDIRSSSYTYGVNLRALTSFFNFLSFMLHF
ncbi:uncharacterized protein LOC120782167 isoform X1 [Bactrocera tryoni]|uniref:uncharacterized protein LOC120782167 isoform X1 n=1 Tax=Bactrocera tryoni TaxID=59916 RepID=UPI001A96B22E|nr:uncharacterized protein LOC120782167 isoform X1 [Bactrocera tryoni]